MTYITLTAEQIQQIEEAFKLAVRTSLNIDNNSKFEKALATIRAARAQADHFAGVGKVILTEEQAQQIGYIAKQDDGDYNGSIIYDQKISGKYIPVYAVIAKFKEKNK